MAQPPRPRLYDDLPLTEGVRTEPSRAKKSTTARLRWSDAHGEHSVDVRDRAVLGSAPQCDIVVRHPTVSRLHAELSWREDGLWIRDEGSTNGTAIQGISIVEANVPDASVMRVGAVDVSIAYVASDDARDDAASFAPMVGDTPVMRATFAQLSRLATSDVTVLIEGETGTGKDLAARVLHERSNRADGPFVVLDCGSLTESLLESELFGFARGAFTGAVAARPGVFEAADHGTLFMDEVGELPLATQARLLRALENRSVRRIGEQQERGFDARVVCATHRDLRAMVNRGEFREDLFFRIAVVSVRMPALRERAGDIAALAKHFVPAAEQHRLTPAVLAALEAHLWPGNVRELRNVLARLVALGELQIASHASPSSPPPERIAPMPTLPDDDASTLADARDRAIERFEREWLTRLLDRHKHNVTVAAQAAGVNRTYLHKLIKRYGL
ncbi:MAG: sigma 54-interacting transcriptional regulator [Myxococcales bacterium]|nr:sigma 54-interacting transcriptional regulator [Myxococcales bacterium]